jgi:hypothetical protein
MSWVQKLSWGLAVVGLVGDSAAGTDRHAERHRSERSFRRVATLPNYLNNSDLAGETVAEIIASTRGGRTLVYTDGLLEEIGFIDITRPQAPRPAGKLAMGGEPTSVAVRGDDLALVAVNTSASFTAPSGHLAVVDIQTRTVQAEIALGGQPDSVALSPSGRYAAIVIENERDEDVIIDGVEGGLPQLPSGFLAIVDLQGGDPTRWSVRRVELSGLSSYAPEDAEAEFVDINASDQAAVTLQENNHIVVVDLPSGRVLSDFSAGSVTLEGVDGTEDGIISLDQSLVELPREPDAVAWVPGRQGSYIATANEGDLFGGSRGFTIFDPRGRVVFDSGSSLEEIAVRHGHYPEARASAKGVEPEAVEYARFGDTDYLFVASERGSFVAVYELERGSARFVQLLPAPLGPEGVHAIPSRGLLVVSGEEDSPSFGVRSSVMIYQLGPGEPSYPQILSADDDAGKPLAWSALSGLAALPGRRNELVGVWDGYYAESRILHIDASAAPARIERSTLIAGGSGNYDPEGIAVAPDGSYWIASEGNAGAQRNRLLHTDAAGLVLAEVGLPAEIEACRTASANRGTLASGFEGLAVSRTSTGYELLVAQQRGWDYTTAACEGLDDDPEGTNPAEPRQARLWVYDPSSAAWRQVAYELEPLPERASWVGLSEISAVPGGFIVLERDNRSGDFAQLKTLVYLRAAALADGIVSRREKLAYDLLPDLLGTHGWVTDKPEGVAVTSQGKLFVVTDNDGVDGWSGETWFLSLGDWRQRFRR